MRRLSLIGGLLLALAAATSTMAATPSTGASVVASPATVTTLTWKAAYSKSPISGTATLVGPSTYASDKVAIRATGLRKGVAVTVRITDRVGTKTHVLATATFPAVLNTKGQVAKTWWLSATQRAALKSAIAHKYPVSFRITANAVTASGLFKAA